MLRRLFLALTAALAWALGLRSTSGFPSPTISFVIDLQGCPATATTAYRPTAGDVSRYARYWNDPRVRGGAAWFFDVCTSRDPRFALSPASDHSVFPVIVPVPCAGRTPYSNMAYNASASCGFFELYAYQELAAAAYAKHAGRNLTIARRIVVNVPMNCRFYGAGSQSCAPDARSCYVWVRTDRSFYWTVPGQTSPLMHTVVHELGHTLTLKHSANVDGVPRPGAAFWEYGDASCVMGSAGSAETCFNAPQARQLGYARPVAALDDARMPLGLWTSTRLPVFTSSRSNHVTLTSAGVPATIFLSARVRNASRSGADGRLSAEYDRALSVHVQRTGGGTGGAKTAIVAVVPIGATFVVRPSTRLHDNDYYATEADDRPPDLFADMAASLAIRLVSLSPSSGAVVSVCRFPNACDANANACECLQDDGHEKAGASGGSGTPG